MQHSNTLHVIQTADAEHKSLLSTIWVPATPIYQLLEEKRSKFHCHIELAEDVVAANNLIARLRQTYPESNHVCSAFNVGVPGKSATGCSDDGEPNGSAGKPMLNVLLHSDVTCVVAAVARTFGGTKLGTGGLARAYGGVVSQAILRLERKQLRILTRAMFVFAFEFESQARHLLQTHNGIVESVHYSDRVQFEVSLSEDELPLFAAGLKNACGGKCKQTVTPA